MPERVNPRRKRFIHAYLGEAQGNATQAAIIAGYSQATAGQSGHRLLKDPQVRQAVLSRLDRVDTSTDRIVQRLGKIANTDVEQVEARDVINASKVILQVNGALQPKASTDNRITVNIGFLQAGALTEHAGNATTSPIATIDADVIAQDVSRAARLLQASGTPDSDE